MSDMVIKDERVKEDIFNKIRYPENKKVGDKLMAGDITKIKIILNNKGVHADWERINGIVTGRRPDNLGVIEIAEELIKDYARLKRKFRK